VAPIEARVLLEYAAEPFVDAAKAADVVRGFSSASRRAT